MRLTPQRARLTGRYDDGDSTGDMNALDSQVQVNLQKNKKTQTINIQSFLPEVVEWIAPLASGHALEHTVCPSYDLVHHRASTV
jgi:hypothetical protein